jgi:hypothetical protein
MLNYPFKLFGGVEAIHYRKLLIQKHVEKNPQVFLWMTYVSISIFVC